MGKHLPSQPEALWRNPNASMSPAQMHRHMREAVAEMKKAAGPQKRRK